MKYDLRERVRRYSISADVKIIIALKKMDDEKCKILLIMDGLQFKGLVTIGDIQRAIIKNISLEDKIESILRESIHIAREGENIDIIKKWMLEGRDECMPIVNAENNVIDILLWTDLFETEIDDRSSSFSCPVVIMAGGEGKRLRPLTNVLPKPLIPIGEKTIIENIMDKFSRYGSNHFFLSVNYKADTIRDYLDRINYDHHYKLEYFQEGKPLGTAGSLTLLKGKLEETFFVSNCDILVDEDYSSILRYHKENKNELTIVSALKHFSMPYGTLQTTQNGILEQITEKPELTFKINTGLYILEPNLLDEIPENIFFHITHLMEKLIIEKRRVGVFPVSEVAWSDIGDWNEYLKFIRR